MGSRIVPFALLALLGCGPAAGGDDAGADADADSDADLDRVEAEDAAPGDPGTDEAADGPEDGPAEVVPPAIDWSGDLRSVDLEVDLGLRQATATLVLEPSDASAASFAAAGLEILSVAGPDGPLAWRHEEGRLDVGFPPGADAPVLTVEYRFGIQADFEGYMSRGSTVTWPWHCGNLFPCRPDPTEGQRFRLEVTGAPDGERVVHPEGWMAEGPAYQIAWARGDYTYRRLGETAGGVEVGLYTLPDGEVAGAAGTADLVEILDWFEATLGPYPFGDRVAAVQVRWRAGAYGGIEHHPDWHVSTPALGDPAVHAHEASHGWFGDGVRIAAWEDLVLSEGTASWLQARVLGQVVGPDAEAAVWAAYERELAGMVGDDAVAWPDPIADRDALLAWLFERTTYIKGAFFYRAVADAVGPEALEAALGSFFRAHVGAAASVRELLDHLEAETGFDPEPLAAAWLRNPGIP